MNNQQQKGNEANSGQPNNAQPTYTQPNCAQPNYTPPNYARPDYQQPPFQQPPYAQMPQRKPTEVMGWLGFGFAGTMLFLVWMGYLIAKISDNPYPVMFLVLVGWLIWALGLAFSIVGIVQATKWRLRKWVSVWGLVFSGLSMISPFLMVMFESYGDVCTLEEAVVPREYEATPASTAADADESPALSCVKLELGYMGLKCYDNRNGTDNRPANIRSLYDLNHELSTWMQVKGIDVENDVVCIEYSDDTDYSDVVKVIDVLNALGVKNYQFME